MARVPGQPRTELPLDFQPDGMLDPIEREEWDHFAAFGMTPDAIVRRCGWSFEQLSQRWWRRHKAAA